jgi:Domain of unknown function (DUF4160)
MPTLIVINGIAIRMFARGEHPPPHIHVVVSGQPYRIQIKELVQYPGDSVVMPGRVRKVVLEWVRPRQDLLLRLWDALPEGGRPPLEIIEELRNN